MYQVLIVDDHPTIGAGTKFILEQNDEFHVTYVKTGALALELMTNIKIDIMLCDLYITGMDTITLTKRALQFDSELKIFIFTGYAYEHLFNELIEIGVCGFLSKKIPVEELKEKIESGLKGETTIPTHLFKRLRAIEGDSIQESTSSKLNTRESHIVKYLVNGLSNRKIAEKIYLSQRGVEYQIQKLYHRFNVKSRAELIKYVVEHELLHLDYKTEK